MPGFLAVPDEAGAVLVPVVVVAAAVAAAIDVVPAAVVTVATGNGLDGCVGVAALAPPADVAGVAVTAPPADVTDVAVEAPPDDEVAGVAVDGTAVPPHAATRIDAIAITVTTKVSFVRGTNTVRFSLHRYI
jgi:hypothetical protein